MAKKKSQDRFEANLVSPSKYRSPQRYEVSDDYADKDVVMWSREDSGLGDEDIDAYLLATAHIPRDIALNILQESEYDIVAATEFCSGYGVPDDLSPLEKKVLLAAAPLADSSTNLRTAQRNFAEHMKRLVPHVPLSSVRDFYHTIGREELLPPRGWEPRVGNIVRPAATRMIRYGYMDFEENSSLYERPGRRTTRAQAANDNVNEFIPRRLNKRNDLHIAMVGYDQQRSDDDDTPPGRRSRQQQKRDEHNESSSIPLTNDSHSPRKRGRPRKHPVISSLPSTVNSQSTIIPVPVESPTVSLIRGIRDESSRRVHSPQEPSSSSSKYRLNSPPSIPRPNHLPNEDMKKKKRLNNLVIDMNDWNDIESMNSDRRIRNTRSMSRGQSPTVSITSNDSSSTRRRKLNNVDTDRIVATSNGMTSHNRRIRSGSREPSSSSSSSQFFSSALANLGDNLRSMHSHEQNLTPQVKRSLNKLGIAMVGWSSIVIDPINEVGSSNDRTNKNESNRLHMEESSRSQRLTSPQRIPLRDKDGFVLPPNKTLSPSGRRRISSSSID